MYYILFVRFSPFYKEPNIAKKVAPKFAYIIFFRIFGTPLPCGRVPSEGTARQCRAFRQGFSPKKNYSSRYYFFAP